MRNAIVFVLGVIVALAGLLFALQVVGAVSGSAISNSPVIALIGIAIAFAGWRGLATRSDSAAYHVACRRRAQTQPPGGADTGDDGVA